MKKWFEIVFCVEWHKNENTTTYEIDSLFTKGNNTLEARKRFEEFMDMFEKEYPAEILTYKVNVHN